MVRAGSVRFAEAPCYQIARRLEGLVGCLRRSEVTVAGGPRWSGFLATCEHFAGPNSESSCCPAPDVT